MSRPVLGELGMRERTGGDKPRPYEPSPHDGGLAGDRKGRPHGIFSKTPLGHSTLMSSVAMVPPPAMGGSVASVLTVRCGLARVTQVLPEMPVPSALARSNW